MKKEHVKGSKNYKLAYSFLEYCLKHPELRFWQALRNWAKVPFVLITKNSPLDILDMSLEDWMWGLKDTFHFEGKNK
jgi:hypothetical protein